VLPGLKLNDTSLGYFRLGYDRTNFQFNGTATAGGVGTFSSSKSSNQGSFDFGLGIETLVYENWSVRTEYNHIWYNSMNSSSPGSSSSLDPSDNQFMLGAVYHFA
jgi:opacity protein-like surface antigen